MKLFDLLQSKSCAISGHLFSVDILVFVTVKFKQNHTAEKKWFEVLKAYTLMDFW